MNCKGIDKYVLSEKCRKVSVTPRSGKIRLCIDGEIIDSGKTDFEIIHNAFNFVAPAELTAEKTQEQKNVSVE